MFGIFATIKIKPDQRDGFLGTIRETVFLSVSDEPGCMRFDVFQDLADENRYILYEVYTGEEAFKNTWRPRTRDPRWRGRETGPRRDLK